MLVQAQELPWATGGRRRELRAAYRDEFLVGTTEIPMVIILGLSDANSGFKIVIRKMGIKDGVAVGLEVGRLEAAWRRLPTVKEEDSHGGCRRCSISPSQKVIHELRVVPILDPLGVVTVAYSGWKTVF